MAILAPAVTATPTATPTTTPGPTTPPVSGSWTLKFADEFNGSSLDLNKWRPNWAFWLTNADAVISKPVNDAYELSCYDPSAVTVGNSNGVISTPGIRSRRGSARPVGS
jgi:subtilisin-like proprotein convertase family protein